MVPLSRQPAYTLVETVLSTFLLAAAFLLVGALFHSALGYSGRAERQVLAAVVAQNKLEQLRAMDYQQWLSYTGGEEVIDGFRVRTDVSGVDLPSPSTDLEAPHAPGERVLPSSAKRASVAVSWGGSDPVGGFTAVTLLGQPARGVPPGPGRAPEYFRSSDPVEIRIGATPSRLPEGATIDLSAQAYDRDGEPMVGVTYRWYVVPITGNGTIVSASRDGRTATFKNVILNPNGIDGHAPGTCQIRVRTVYRGVEAWGQTGVIELE